MNTKQINQRKFRTFKEYNLDKLRDPKEARIYLSVALEEYEQNGDVKALLLALRDVVEAQGGIGKLAARTSLNRQNLYKALSSRGAPRFETVGEVLHALGFRISVEPMRT